MPKIKKIAKHIAQLMLILWVSVAQIAQAANPSIDFEYELFELTSWIAFYDIHKKSCPEYIQNAQEEIKKRDRLLERLEYPTIKRQFQQIYTIYRHRDRAESFNSELLMTFDNCEQIPSSIYVEIQQNYHSIYHRLKTYVNGRKSHKQIIAEIMKKVSDYKLLAIDEAQTLAFTLIQGRYFYDDGVLTTLVPIEKDEELGIDILTHLALNHQSLRAATYLGKMYSSYDMSQALEFYDIAADQGDVETLELLASHFACINDTVSYRHYFRKLNQADPAFATLLADEISEFGAPVNCTVSDR